MTAPNGVVRELAYAKLNLVLHVGRPNADGMHPLCSLFASIDLADMIEVRAAAADHVHCPGVSGPNLCADAVATIRAHAQLPPLEVSIDKRIPVAAGLGGGSADAAAVLRAANAIAGSPLDPAALRELAAGLGSDVPSQVQPRHALVEGTGERVEPIALPALAAVLVPRPDGLSTRSVYAELDRARRGALGSTPQRCARSPQRPPRPSLHASRTISSRPPWHCGPSLPRRSRRCAQPERWAPPSAAPDRPASDSSRRAPRPSAPLPACLARWSPPCATADVLEAGAYSLARCPLATSRQPWRPC